MIKDKKKMFLVTSVLVMLLLLTAVTYAFFNYTRTGTTNIVRVGRIFFNSEEGTAINLTNVFPIDRSMVATENDNVGSLTIHITGDTTYTEGIEYLVSAVDVNNTIGEGNNLKTIPISVEVSYEETENKTIGESDKDYFDNRGGNTSLYKVLSSRSITEGKKIVVGYIKPDQTGIDGTITINAYLDKDKIAISDTYPERTYTEYIGEDTYEVNPNMSIEELNTCTAYFAPMAYSYILNPNMTTNDIDSCVSYFTNMGINNILHSGESLETFCDGTGTVSSAYLIDVINNSYTDQNMIDDLISMNIIVFQNDNQLLEDFCNGTGEINGKTFQEKLDNNSFLTSELLYLKNNHIINQLTYQTVNGWTDGTTSSWVNGRTVLTSDEWNSLQENGISFKVKVEANEGIWVPAQGNAMNTFPNEIFNIRHLIKEVYFNEMTDEAMHNAYDNATIKADITYDNEGEVLAWLVENATDSTKYTMYIASTGKTFLTTGVNLFVGFSSMDKIEFNNIDTSRVTSMVGMFNSTISLKSIDLSSFDTSNVENMANMFYYTGLTSLDLHSLNLQKVNNMIRLIAHSKSLQSINMEGLELNNLTDMSQMFYEDENLVTVNFLNMKTPKIVSMTSLFDECIKLENINVSGLGSDDLTDITHMFEDANNLVNINMSNFNFGKVTSLYSFLNKRNYLSVVDLSNIKINNVTNMEYMFSEDTALETIYVSSDWNIDNVTNSSYMFYGCLSIVGGNGTVFDSTKIDKSMALIDNNNHEGYLTLKTN